jgi:hypothetical protein
MAYGGDKSPMCRTTLRRQPTSRRPPAQRRRRAGRAPARRPDQALPGQRRPAHVAVADLPDNVYVAVDLAKVKAGKVFASVLLTFGDIDRDLALRARAAVTGSRGIQLSTSLASAIRQQTWW